MTDYYLKSLSLLTQYVPACLYIAMSLRKGLLAYRSALLILSGVEPSAKHQKRAFACVTADKQCHWPSSIYLDHQAIHVF
jgi:hypothetical protein